EGLPDIPLGRQQEGCKDLWQRFSLEDRGDEAWRAGLLPSFSSDDLAGWLARPGGDGVDGNVYAALMRDKIDHVVRQTIHLVRSRLRQRLAQIGGELSLLTGERETAAA
ncbi:MAG: hypothetical protein K2P78_12245, partial [Gemmataceae bacterium]|nr:hypothetical protein [Gemmataceae bacterium]